MPSAPAHQHPSTAPTVALLPKKQEAAPTSSQDTTRIFLLKRIEAVGPHGVLLPKPEKTIALFAFLCLSAGRFITKDELAETFWNNSNRECALDSLRHAIYSLARIEATWTLTRERRGISLDVRNCWVDVFEIADLPELLLQDIYGISNTLDKWIHGQRAAYERRWYDVLGRQIKELTAAGGDPSRRATVARQLLGVLPSSGLGIRTLMTAFVDLGERTEAIRAFESYRGSIEDDGLPLSSETAALYKEIRSIPKIEGSISSYADRVWDNYREELAANFATCGISGDRWRKTSCQR